VLSREHESKHIRKIFAMQPIQHAHVYVKRQDKLTSNTAAVSGARVRKVISNDPYQFTSAGHQLTYIDNAIEQLNKNYKRTLSAIRQRIRQVQKKTKSSDIPKDDFEVPIRRMTARPATELPIRHFISNSDELPVRRFPSNSDEKHRFSIAEMTARTHRLNEIIIQSSNIITWSTKIVARSKGQYNTIASGIEKRIKTMKAKQQPELLAPRKRELAFSEYLKTISGTAHGSKQIGNKGHEELLQHLGNIESRQIRRKTEIVVRRSTAILRVKVDKLQAGISKVQEELRKALKHIDQLQMFTHAANHRAFEVYGLHIALRLRLGKMILYRQKRQNGDRQSKMAFGRLETRLLELRAYDEELFSGASVTSSQQTRERLAQLELQNEVQRSLVLSTQFGEQLRGTRPLVKWRHRKTKNETNPRHTTNTPALYIRYRRNRGRTTVSPVYRKPRRISLHSIRYHDARLKQRPVPRTERARPRRSAQVAAEKKESDRSKLLDTVSSWLEGGEAATPSKEVEVARRPFGSKAFESDIQETVMQEDGLALLTKTMGKGRDSGRKRRQ
jgi:hypothetical protein